MRGKLSELQFDVSLFFYFGEKVQKPLKTMGQIFPIVFSMFHDFSPQLEHNNIIQCSSDSFPRMVMYILFVENFHNLILMHSCLPILGILF